MPREDKTSAISTVKSATKPSISPPEESTAEDAVEKTFEDLGIIPELCDACRSMGFKNPRPIQTEAIPYALEGRDLIGLAETGSGKTAAFGLPMLQGTLFFIESLKKYNNQFEALMKAPSAYFGLIIAPTRELATQIKTHIDALGSIINVRTVLILGGLPMMEQAKALQKNPHIIIATPGRLKDHLKHTKGFHMRNLKFLVLDEADKLLEQGFMEEIIEILKVLPQDRHTCLFSATMDDKVGTLQRASLKNPVFVSVVTKTKTVQGLVQEWALIAAKYKDHALFYLLEILNKGKRAIIFARTIRKVQELGYMLRALHVSAIPIHSKLTQDQRNAALGMFVRADRSILIATDVASRGLDITGVDLVVNYNLPDTADTYIHRVGRTARAGRTGKAFTIVDQYEAQTFLKLEKYLGAELKQVDLPKEEIAELAASVDEAQIVATRELKMAEEKSKKRGLNGHWKRKSERSRQAMDQDEG
jgi:ATP-dependent RNA helicase DDX47/RRP3